MSSTKKPRLTVKLAKEVLRWFAENIHSDVYIAAKHFNVNVEDIDELMEGDPPYNKAWDDLTDEVTKLHVFLMDANQWMFHGYDPNGAYEAFLKEIIEKMD